MMRLQSNTEEFKIIRKYIEMGTKAMKKPSVVEGSDRERITTLATREASSNPEIFRGCDDVDGRDSRNVEDEEQRLIESTMIELLLRRGPDKTC